MKVLFLVLLIFNLVTLKGQQLFFRQQETSQEIVQEGDQKLFRFKNGPLFITSALGFYIYDGKGSSFVKRTDNGNPAVSFIQEDQGKYWIGYEDGGVFQWNHQKLSPWLIPEGWPTSRITGFTRDSQGQFWVGTYGEGLYVYSRNILYHFGTDDGMPSHDIYWIMSAGVRGILIGTDNGAYLCSFRNGKKNIQKVTTQKEFDTDILIKAKHASGSSHCYISGYQSGLWEFNTITLECRKIKNTATENIQYSPGKHRIYTIPTDIKNSILEIEIKSDEKPALYLTNLVDDLEAEDILVDDEGLLWIICANNGLVSSPLDFKSFQTDIEEMQCILEYNNQLWIGTDQGLFLMDQKSRIKRQILKQNVLCMTHIPERKEVWVGTFGNGILVLNESGRLLRKYSSGQMLSNDNIFSIVFYEENIWVASLAGIDIISQDGNPIMNLNRKNGLPTDYIYTLFSDNSGNIWAGTDGEGLVCIDTQFKIKSFRMKQTVISFAKDDEGKIWFATPNRGIGYVHKNAVSTMDERDGLSNVQISGLSVDHAGNILSIHQNGIDVIDPTSCIIHQTGHNIGIQKWRKREHAFYNNGIGSLFIPYKNQIIAYRHSDFSFTPPFLIITGFYIGQQESDPSIESEFPYYQHDMILNYQGIWMQKPENVIYRYQLNPMDPTWRYTQDHTIMYSDLKPGKYQLTLESSENSKFNDAVRKTITFVIHPPYWTRSWFLVLIITFVSVIITYGFKIRNRRRGEMEAIKMNEVKAQLETLKSQINPHFLFNSFNTLISVIESNPKDAVIFVEKMSDFYRNMLQFRDKDLIPLSEELAINENYQYLLKMRFGDGIIFHNLVGNGSRFKIIPLTLQLLSENAIKHNIVSLDQPLHLYFYLEGNWLICKNEIKPRLSVEKSTHFGLQTLAARYKAITGEGITANAENSEFLVKIPLVEK